MSWDYFGYADNAGTVGFLTRSAVLGALGEVVDGKRVCVTLPMDQPDPPFYGRKAYRHVRFMSHSAVQDEFLNDVYPQASTQWDGLRHRKDPEIGFYGGASDQAATDSGTRLGVDAWARTGIVGRGLLVDIPGFCAATAREWDPTVRQVVSADLIEEILDHQKCPSRPGDILLLRTGYIDAYLASSAQQRAALQAAGTSPGLYADERMAEFLWDHQFAAVAADNPAVEAMPPDPGEGSLHLRLIPRLGFALGEFFTFAALAQACQADGRYGCMFVSVPWHLPGGVGSPGNAVVIR